MGIKFWIDILSLVLAAIYLFIILIINAKERADFNSLPDEIDVGLFSDSTFAVLSNIVSDPVVNLRVVDASEGCSSGVSPTLFTWETVTKYCQCSNSVSRKSCSRSSSCKNHSKVSIPFKRWKGKLFCLDKLKTEDWKLSQGGSFACADGFRLCKGGVCVRKSILECPITDIVVSQAQPSSSEGTYKNVTLFVGGNSIFISRDIDKTPLVTITAGIPSTPCINARVYPKRSNGNSYPIIQLQPVGCEASGNYGVDNSSHVPIDIDNEWNFHDESNYAYFYALPGYREYVGNEQVTLFARKKIEFKSNKGVCLTFDYQSLKDVASDLNIFEGVRLGTNICAFVVCSLGIITFIILAVLDCFRKKGGNSLLITMNVLFIVFAIVNSIILIILCGIGVPYASAIDSNSTLMNELADNDCFKVDGYNKLFNNLQNYMLASFPSGKSHNIANLVISILCLITESLLLIISSILSCSKSEYSTRF